jgi:hypothetical protein
MRNRGTWSLRRLRRKVRHARRVLSLAPWVMVILWMCPSLFDGLDNNGRPLRP